MCAAVVTADRGFTWSDEETTLLLQLWGANDAQSELTGNKRNFPVYEKISESMTSMGYMRTASQCREKIKRMKREYSLTKQQNDRRSSGPKKNMRFFEQFHKILLEKQNRTTQRNNAAMKSSAAADVNMDETSSKKRSWDGCERNTNAHSKAKSAANKRDQNMEKGEISPWAPDILLVEGEEAPEILLDGLSSPSAKLFNGELSENLTKKSKPLPEMPLLKCMMDSLTLKLMKYQTESDARIMSKIEELESERTATDERIQKMWMDFEERRRNEEREHELNVMKLFHDIVNQMKNDTAKK